MESAPFTVALMPHMLLPMMNWLTRRTTVVAIVPLLVTTLMFADSHVWSDVVPNAIAELAHDDAHDSAQAAWINISTSGVQCDMLLSTPIGRLGDCVGGENVLFSRDAVTIDTNAKTGVSSDEVISDYSIGSHHRHSIVPYNIPVSY